MPPNLRAILDLEVPLIVRLGRRRMRLAQLTELAPGSMLELPRKVGDDLDILVNQKTIARGTAVRVGENIGVRITRIGAVSRRVRALGDERAPAEPEAPAPPNGASA